MRVVVAYKWAGDPQEAKVGPDGSVDWSRSKAGVGEYDQVAIEVGRRLVDAVGGELIGISAGGPDVASSLARKAALSRGLDRLVVVADLPENLSGSAGSARVLAGLVTKIGDVDLVLAGAASTDVAASIVPALLGAGLGWPTVTEASSVEASEAGLHISREVAGGSEELEMSTPAVVAVAADATQARVPGMRDILAAGKKSAETVACADLGVEAPVVADSVEASPAPTPARGRQLIDAGDVDEAAHRLVEALHSAQVL